MQRVEHDKEDTGNPPYVCDDRGRRRGRRRASDEWRKGEGKLQRSRKEKQGATAQSTQLPRRSQKPGIRVDQNSQESHPG